MGKKPHLTVQERIMLHLLGFLKQKESFEVPYSLTQDGIAEAVRVKRSYVSSANKELIKKGLLEEVLSHVKGEPRRRKTYFLTPEGLDTARKLREKVGEINITLKDGSHEREIRIRWINRELKKRMSLLSVLDSISEDGKFDVQAVSKGAKQMRGDHQFTFPRPRYFFGRENEQKEVKEWLGSGVGMLALRGIAGIGKTTLMAKIAHDEANGRKVLWYKFHDWSTQRNVLTNLSDFLKTLGRRGLFLYLQQNITVDVGDIQALLRTEFKGSSALLIFDDFHRADGSILQLFEAVLEIAGELEGVKIAVVGREIPRFYDRRDALVKERVWEIQLDGLDKESSRKLLELRKIDSVDLDSIYESTKGHPLSLELIESTRGTLGRRNIEQYLSEELLGRLSPGEKRLLRFASVFRFPVSSEALLSVPRDGDSQEITHEIIDGLVDKSLLKISDAHYDVHDVIREFFYKRLNPQTKRLFHEKVADYFEDETGDLALIEAMYHHIMADSLMKTVNIAIMYGEHLVHRGLLEEFFEILSMISKDQVPKMELAAIETLEGDILIFLGEWDAALERYERSLTCAEELGDKQSVAQAYYKIAAIHYRKGALDEALRLNNESLRIMKEGYEITELSKLYNNMGVIQWKKGDLEEAAKNYNESLKIADELKDKRGIARALNNLGIIHWEKGEVWDAIDFYQRSLKLTEELGDKQTVAILYDNLGEAFRLQGEITKAKRYYERSLELAKMLGFRWQIAEVYRNMGNVYKGEKGKMYLTLAYEMFMDLGAEQDAAELRKKLNGPVEKTK